MCAFTESSAYNEFLLRLRGCTDLSSSLLVAFCEKSPNQLTLGMLGNFGCFYRLMIAFFAFCCSKIYICKTIHSGIPSECQIVWIQIRPDETSGLIWVKLFANQKTKVVFSRESVRGTFRHPSLGTKPDMSHVNRINVNNKM